MKEFLINKLAEQAGIEPVAIHNNPLIVSYHMSHETMNKFAELIVRECAEIADKGWASPGIQIKQHFVVE
jgi:hypothetical protein